MNIYISKLNEDRLRQEPSMSGLINLLLDRHYEFYKPGTLIEDVTDESVVGNKELAEVLRANQVVVDTLQTVPPIITKRNEDMDFCKHGAVKGFCKKGCK